MFLKYSAIVFLLTNILLGFKANALIVNSLQKRKMFMRLVRYQKFMIRFQLFKTSLFCCFKKEEAPNSLNLNY